tara:strand:- start:137 stop:925 length:789 start_codon:yes stop_codon:yes gene_type:complete
MKTYNVLSLGAGVQSSTVAMLSVEGIIPKFDAWVFGDPLWEGKEVYQQVEWLEKQAKKIGTKFYRTSKRDVRDFNRTDGVRTHSIPLHTLNPRTGKKGLLRRTCTYELKILPVEKVIREQIVGLKPRKWMPNDVHINVHLGISTDEMERVTKSRHKWATHKYPLLELKWDRNKCLEWYTETYSKVPPRSACLGCPYHNNAFYKSLTQEELNEVIEFDESIRHKSKDGYLYYVSRDRVPIKDLNLDLDNGASFLDECSGLCGN